MTSKYLGAFAIAMLTTSPAFAGSSGPTFYYVPNSLVESMVIDGPWTLHERGNAIVHPHDASGINVPAVAGTPYAGYCDSKGKPAVNHGKSVMQPYYFPFVRQLRAESERGDDKRGDDKRERVLEGFFDYRPRNEQEVAVAAISVDWGATWIFTSEALALNPYCPANPNDPDNNSVQVGSPPVNAPYGSNSDNAADNGLGHPFVLTVAGVQRIYTLDRANGQIDSAPLVVHTIPWTPGGIFLTKLPTLGFLSPFAPSNPVPFAGKYPLNLDPTSQFTSGLLSPDAILGAVNFPGGVVAVIYVSKVLNGTTKDASGLYPILQPPYNQAPYNINYPTPVQNCTGTPSFALTNLINGKARKPNTDVIAIRVASTTDGLNFTDIGAVPYAPANGALMNPNSVGTAGQADSFGGIRWLGSGSIVPLANGKYGMFFGAGNCLDNDSDGFHFIGYAETQNVVNGPGDLLTWNVINGLDNPILSTDTVTDYSVAPAPGWAYPHSTPIVNQTGVNLLTAAQVAPWVAPPYYNPPFTPPHPITPASIVVPPGGYNSNFYSGRLYDPQAIYTDSQTLTIVFAGYNTPQPSNNLGDYRSIGRFQLQVPKGYFLPF